MTRLIRAALAALTLTFAPLAAGLALADDRADAIRNVIAQQLDAFRADDWRRAYGYASPEIQRMFRNPGSFGRMVRGGYPMVWRPAEVETGPLIDGPDGPVQIMYFRDADGAHYVAAYEMKQVGGEWRIGGVKIRRTPQASA
ncbi:MAG: DUF4864 domain-containing protein [Rubrimonas sp.]